MQHDRLKDLVSTGRYKLEPSQIAEAMLRRRGVRELLAQGLPAFTPVDRSPSAPAPGRQAA